MKKVFKCKFATILSFLFCVALLSGCTAAKHKSVSKDIKFYTVYNDFVTSTEVYHADTINVMNDIGHYENWHTFRMRNFKGIKLPSPSLYDRTLICIRLIPANTTLLGQRYIDHVLLKDSKLTVYLRKTGIKCSLDLETNHAYDLILATIDTRVLPKKFTANIQLLN